MRFLFAFISFIIFFTYITPCLGTSFHYLREKMVREQLEFPLDGRTPIRDRRVLWAMKTVPRHLFVRKEDMIRAYEDYPLPIGWGQTISQPYIVALMTEMLKLAPHHRVLEIGTGSGYQAAVLSLLCKEVYSIEIIESLAKEAIKRLQRLGYKNIRVKIGDGYYGWPEYAPFDRIILTCAFPKVPPPLIKQLKRGGLLCMPLGPRYGIQYLTILFKMKDGSCRIKKETPVRFVPMIRRKNLSE